MASEHAIHCPPRVIVGHCPSCGGVVVHCNDYGVWELVKCVCGWRGGDDQLANMHRIERYYVVCISASVKIRIPPPRPTETVEVPGDVL